MRNIMRSGALRAEVGMNPVNQRMQLSARRADLEQFSRTYVSLTALRKKWRTTAPGMSDALRAAGVRRTFPPEVNSVGIYRRSEVARGQDFQT